jgi:hypothetical protein
MSARLKTVIVMVGAVLILAALMVLNWTNMRDTGPRVTPAAIAVPAAAEWAPE